VTRPRVKICGLTRPEDVRLAAALGADALGFIFAPSKRRLTADQARALVAEAPVWTSRVGVFGPDQHGEAGAIAEALRLDTLQFHGAPDVGALRALGRRFRVVQAVGVGEDATDLAARLGAIAPHVDALLLDTARPGQLGGTGEAFAWDVLDGLAPGVPVIVAGGLGPENVGALLAQHPVWGVDVCSGVESAPGVKDAGALERFFGAIAGAGRT
jgi:phosphoribosylanthranilate isomerase